MDVVLTSQWIILAYFSISEFVRKFMSQIITELL
jgi:hypothetical protein